MKISWEIIYLGVFLQTFILSLLLTPLSEKIGFKLNIVDKPSAKKVHQGIIARSGGFAIFFAFILTLLIDAFIIRFFLLQANYIPENIKIYLNNIPSVSFRLIAILIGATFIFIVGSIDDKFSLGPWTKLLLQIISVIPLICSNIRIVFFIPYPIIGFLLTILWVVLLTNSFNFLDNMNGLTSGIASIVLLVLSYISYQHNEIFMTMIFLALAGSILGFWRYNFFKGRPFMGDGGSLFIGYSIAALTIIATYYKKGVPTSLPALMPLVVLGVPLFDTITVIWLRMRRGAPIMQGDTNHFSHRLVALGMSKKQAVLFIYLATFCVAINGILLLKLTWKGAILLGLQTLLIFILIYILERTSIVKTKTEK